MTNESCGYGFPSRGESSRVRRSVGFMRPIGPWHDERHGPSRSSGRRQEVWPRAKDVLHVLHVRSSYVDWREAATSDGEQLASAHNGSCAPACRGWQLRRRVRAIFYLWCRSTTRATFSELLHVPMATVTAASNMAIRSREPPVDADLILPRENNNPSTNALRSWQHDRHGQITTRSSRHSGNAWASRACSIRSLWTTGTCIESCTVI